MSLSDDHSDDAINIAPDLHTIIYEDDKMRALRVTVPAGATADMHWHPHNINFVLSAGTLEFSKPDGSVVTVDLFKDQVTSATSDSFHAVKNTGNTTVETIQVELKY